MSISDLYPKDQSQGAIFLTFGVALAAAVIRWQQPSLYENPTVVLAAVAVCSSVVASTLFYVRPDRLIPRVVVWMCYRKYGQSLVHIIARFRLALEMWRTKTVLSWDEPATEAKWTVKRTVDDKGLQREVWVVTAWFFFVPALALVLYAYTLPFVDILVWSTVVGGVTGVAMAWHSRNLLFRAFAMSGFRLMQDSFGIFRASDPGDRPTRNWFIGDSTSVGKDAPVGWVLDELEVKLKRRDMDGFQARFTRLDMDTQQWVGEVYKEMYGLVAAQWVSYLMAEGEIAKRNQHSRLSYVINLLESLEQTTAWQEAVRDFGDLKPIYDVVSDDLNRPSVLLQRCNSLRRRFGVPQSLRTLLGKSALGAMPDEVLSVLKEWAEDGVRDYDRILLRAGEDLDYEKCKVIGLLMVRYADRGLFSQSGPRMAAQLMRDGGNDEQIVLSLLHSDNPETVLAVLGGIQIGEHYLSHEVLSLVQHSDHRIAFELLHRLQSSRLLEASIRKMIESEDKTDIRTGVLIALGAAFELGPRHRERMSHPLIRLVLESRPEVIAAFLNGADKAGLLTIDDVNGLLAQPDMDSHVDAVLQRIRAKLERAK